MQHALQLRMEDNNVSLLRVYHMLPIVGARRAKGRIKSGKQV